MREIDTIIIHCSDSEFGDAATIREWHTLPPPKGNGWQDIGYHFVILNGYRKGSSFRAKILDCEKGAIELGRPVELSGAHCQDHNKTSIGICLIGKLNFSSYQLNALDELVFDLTFKYPSIKKIYGHCEMDSARGKTCPNLPMDQIREFLQWKN